MSVDSEVGFNRPQTYLFVLTFSGREKSSEKNEFQSSSDVSLRTHWHTAALMAKMVESFNRPQTYLFVLTFGENVSVVPVADRFNRPQTYLFVLTIAAMCSGNTGSLFQSSSDVSLRTHLLQKRFPRPITIRVSIVLRRISSYSRRKRGSHEDLEERFNRPQTYLFVLTWSGSRWLVARMPGFNRPQTYLFVLTELCLPTVSSVGMVSIVLRRISSYSPETQKRWWRAQFVSIVLRRISSYSLMVCTLRIPT